MTTPKRVPHGRKPSKTSQANLTARGAQPGAGRPKKTSETERIRQFFQHILNDPAVRRKIWHEMRDPKIRLNPQMVNVCAIFGGVPKQETIDVKGPASVTIIHKLRNSLKDDKEDE